MSKKNNTYYQILNQALKRYHDATWLGEECPLASLFFAGDWINTESAILTSKMRGEGLQKMLKTALDSMWVGEMVTTPSELHEIAQEGFFQDGRASLPYQFLLLELRYFRHVFPSRSYPHTNQDFLEFLGLSKTQFFDHLKYAVNSLGDFLHQLSNPTFRLERPGHQTDHIGRTVLVEQLLTGLKDGQSAAISGIGGIGKTALGKLVLQGWDSEHVFWYTIRPLITDHIESLIYALGAFLHKKSSNRSILWKQLMSGPFQNGKIELYMGLLKQDLELLESEILLCFDEVDLLQTDITSERGVEHRAFLFLLENLSDFVPVLLMGQHIPLDAKQHVALRPLDIEQTKALITAKRDDLELSADDITTVHTASRGVPRLLELALALYQTGESLTSIVDTLSDSASAHAVMGRLWNRLDIDEQQTLATLAISQGGIPAELLPETYQQKLPVLVQRTLINSSPKSGLLLDELISRLVHRLASRKLRDQGHLTVADIRYTLGEYTMAAYHYAQAEAYDLAIEQWFPHKESEIERGHAQRAREIFLNLSSRHLKKQQEKKLQVICNQLHFLVGDAKRVIEETRHLDNKKSNDVDEIDPEIHRQLGDAYAQLDNVVEAQKQYEQTTTLLTDVIRKVNESSGRLIKLHMRDSDIQKAEKQLKRIRAYSDFAHGHLSYRTSDFLQAQIYFEDALTLAKSIDDSMMVADLKWNLAALASLRGDLEKTVEYYESAFYIISGSGDIVRANKVQADFGYAYLVLKRYKEAINKLEPALNFFRSTNDVPTQIFISLNLSEAYFHADEFDLARSTALQLLQFEEQKTLPYAYHVLGLIEGEKSRLNYALDILEQGIDIAKRNADRYIEAYLLSAIGDVLCKNVGEKIDQSANTYYEKAIVLFNEIGLTNEVQETESKLLSLN